MAVSSSAPESPVTLEIPYPESLNRWLIFVKWLLAIPHLIILSLLRYVVALLTFIAFFAILFTGKYPEGMFKFVVGFLRWSVNVNAYVLLLRDEYPPFSFDEGQYPVAFHVAYPDNLNRWLIFVKWLLAIPNLIVLALFSITWAITLVIAFFAILFTGRYPQGLFDFSVGVQRWTQRALAYVLLLRDEYPPFGIQR